MKSDAALTFFLKGIIFISFSFLLAGSKVSAQNLGGIGAKLSAVDSSEGYKLPMIIEMVPNSPAAVTLKQGMFILSVNGNSCRDRNIQDVVGLIRGEVGTHVILSVADNKQGKNAVDKDMVRIILPQAQDNTPAADAVTPFNEWCENEVKQIHRQRHTIVKTFNSDCGDYFFNFNADTGLYHVEVYTLEDKGAGGSGTAFVATARVFDNKNEAGATYLIKVPLNDAGNFVKGHLGGEIRFPHPGVGVVNTQIKPLTDVKKCMAMCIVVYR